MRKLAKRSKKAMNILPYQKYKKREKNTVDMTVKKINKIALLEGPSKRPHLCTQKVRKNVKKVKNIAKKVKNTPFLPQILQNRFSNISKNLQNVQKRPKTPFLPKKTYF